MRNPATYEKLTAEVDAAVADRTLSMPVTYAEAVKLPYLKACINESMRLHPSVALTMPRLVPASGATISGFQFPKGYRVGINPAVVHYDKDVFGPDADGFNPDRWINGDAVQMEKAMIQFGAGPHVCLGKNVSTGSCFNFGTYADVSLRFHSAKSTSWSLILSGFSIFVSRTPARNGRPQIFGLISSPISTSTSKKGRIAQDNELFLRLVLLQKSEFS